MIIDALETGAAEWKPAAAPATIKEMLGTYERQSAEIVRRLKVLPAARWDGRCGSSAVSGRLHRWLGAFCSTSCTIAARSRRICVQSGLTVPQIYGPSGDEP